MSHDVTAWYIGDRTSINCLGLQPDLEPGDVVIVLQQKDHEVFTREGDSLIMTRKISLTEALCGFHFTLTQLDGRELVIKNPPGTIIEPGSWSNMGSVIYANSIYLNIQEAFLHS